MNGKKAKAMRRQEKELQQTIIKAIQTGELSGFHEGVKFACDLFGKALENTKGIGEKKVTAINATLKIEIENNYEKFLSKYDPDIVRLYMEARNRDQQAK